MAEIIKMKAVTRVKGGKGAARAERRAGRVPAVIYGDEKEPELISVDFVEVHKQVNRGRFESTLVEIDVDGKTTRTIPRDVQLDPVRDFPLHVDFLRLGKDARIAVEVPVEFINEADAPGLKRGGALNIVRYDVEVFCRATEIPEKIVADLAGLEIGDSLHISNVGLPEGVEPTITGRDFTLCTITGAGGEAEEEAGEEEEESVEVPTVAESEASSEESQED